jgi:hypothetical protein
MNDTNTRFKTIINNTNTRWIVTLLTSIEPEDDPVIVTSHSVMPNVVWRIRTQFRVISNYKNQNGEEQAAKQRINFGNRDEQSNTNCSAISN